MPYYPLPPDRLYLSADDWRAGLGDRATGQFAHFRAPEGTPATVSLDGRRSEDFSAARNRPDIELLDAVRERVGGEIDRGRRVVIAGYTRGSRDRLAGLLVDHGLEAVAAVDHWADAMALAPHQVGVVVLGLENGFSTGELALYTEQDIFGDRLIRRRPKDRRAENFLSEISSLAQGDFVVHIDHGIGRYEGLETLAIGGRAPRLPAAHLRRQRQTLPGRSKISTCCRVTARKRPAPSSTNSAAPAGRRARQEPRSASAKSRTGCCKPPPNGR